AQAPPGLSIKAQRLTILKMMPRQTEQGAGWGWACPLRPRSRSCRTARREPAAGPACHRDAVGAVGGGGRLGIGYRRTSTRVGSRRQWRVVLQCLPKGAHVDEAAAGRAADVVLGLPLDLAAGALADDLAAPWLISVTACTSPSARRAGVVCARACRARP